jgi:hypothetical protein
MAFLRYHRPPSSCHHIQSSSDIYCDHTILTLIAVPAFQTILEAKTCSDDSKEEMFNKLKNHLTKAFQLGIGCDSETFEPDVKKLKQHPVTNYFQNQGGVEEVCKDDEWHFKTNVDARAWSSCAVRFMTEWAGKSIEHDPTHSKCYDVVSLQTNALPVLKGFRTCVYGLNARECGLSKTPSHGLYSVHTHACHAHELTIQRNYCQAS